MSLIYNLVTDGRDIVNKTKAGIHPSETQHQLKKINDQIRTVREHVQYLDDLLLDESSHKCGDPAHQESVINIRLVRDRKSLLQMLNHLRSAVSHLQGHDWGIFAE